MIQVTKQNLIDYVQGIFVKTNTDPELSEEFGSTDIEICISRNWTAIIGEKCIIAKRNKQWQFLDSYTKTYLNVPMILDPVRFKYYSVLPSQIMDIPQNEGIRMICPMRKSESKYRRQSSDSDVMVLVQSSMDESHPLIYRNGTSPLGGTDVAKVLSGVRYVPEGENIYYIFNDADNPDIFNVGMKLVVPFSAYHADDTLPEPFIKFDERGNPQGDLLDRVLDEFGKKNAGTSTKQNVGEPNQANPKQ